MNKLIFVLLDGLADTIAETKMGFMSGLEEYGIAKKITINAALPTLSRPLYETLLTGKLPNEHGVFHNDIRRKSNQISLFHSVTAAGGITAAVAYHWVSELYLHGEMNSYLHRFKTPKTPETTISHGIFYYDDHYPDSHVFMDAHLLIEKHAPNFILVHTMNIDDSGHKYGVNSHEYSHAVRMSDGLLARNIPHWRSLGYEILITSDHGMGSDGSHGGTHPSERTVPFWYIGNNPECSIEKQTDIYPFVLECLDIQVSSMKGDKS